MTFDSRLLIQTIPSLRDVEAREFLKKMNESEKETQTAELKLFNEAIAKRDSNEIPGIGYLLLGSTSLTGLITSLLVGGLMTAFKGSRVMTKPMFIFTAVALTLITIFSFRRMCKNFTESSQVEYPPIEADRRARLETEIREIKERLRTGNPEEAEKVHLLKALDALKGNRALFVSRPIYV